MRPRARLPGVVRFLYTQNPFYVISSCLVMYGLYLAFRGEGAAVDDPWILAFALCGYTALMAVTAILVIRLGKVWEDARSIVLIVLLQFIAVSMSFDEICTQSAVTAAGLLMFCLALAVMISEGLVGGLGIRFPLRLRIPYYALLGLFFVYPLWVSPRLNAAMAEVVAMRLYYFPAIAGIVLLTLIPAIRGGRTVASNNGTPWPWPWFPWTIFVLLILGIFVRAYSLSYSFNVYGWEMAFGAYFYTPLLLAVGVLLIEAAAVGRRAAVARAVACFGPVLILISVPVGNNAIYQQFLRHLVATTGSPLWLGVIAMIAFYVYGWLRRLPGAELGIAASCLLLCCVGRSTVGWDSLVDVRWQPLAVIGGAQWLACLRRPRSQRCLAGCLLTIATIAVAGRHTWLLAYDGIVPIHLALASVLCVAVTFDDRFAAVLGKLGVGLVVMATIGAVAAMDRYAVPSPAVCGYLTAMTGVAWVYWRAMRDRWWFFAAVINAGIFAAAGCWLSYWQLETAVGRQALTPLAWGTAFFAMAALITAVKAGLISRIRDHLIGWGILRLPE